MPESWWHASCEQVAYISQTSSDSGSGVIGAHKVYTSGAVANIISRISKHDQSTKNGGSQFNRLEQGCAELKGKPMGKTEGS